MISKNDIKELILKNLKDEHFLIDISVSVNNQIQVFIDSKEGLPIKECISYSRLIENHFDREVEDYELSVSSGGLDLPFTVLAQFEKNLNKEVELITKEGKKYQGILIDFNEEQVVLETEVKEIPEGKKRKELVKKEVSFKKELEIKSIKPFFSFKKNKK